jgi:hypothetical protein
MGIRIAVIDTTGSVALPNSIFLEGKMSESDLRKKALSALGLLNVSMFSVEVRDENKMITRKITSKCTIFIVRKDPVSGIIDDDNPFSNIFGAFDEKSGPF